MKNNIDILMLGDSLIARGEWDTLLYPKKVVNLGHDGDTTKDILSRIDIPIELKSKSIFLMVGINDMSGYKSIDNIFDDYIKILKKLKISTSKIVVQSILYTQMKLFNKKVKILNSKLEIYCKEHELLFININDELSKDETLLDSYTTDGLHLNVKAYIVWARLLRNYF